MMNRTAVVKVGPTFVPYRSIVPASQAHANIPIKRPYSEVLSANQVCDECGDAFHSLAALSLHRFCHDIKEKPPVIQPKKEEPSSGGSSACPKCGESLSVFLNSLPFKCRICEYQNKDQLQFFEHLKVHYGHVVEDVAAEQEIIIMDHEVPVIEDIKSHVDNQSITPTGKGTEKKGSPMAVTDKTSDCIKDDDSVDTTDDDRSRKTPSQKMMNMEDLDEEDCRSSDEPFEPSPSDQDISQDFIDDQEMKVVKKPKRLKMKPVRKTSRSYKKSKEDSKPICPSCNKMYASRDSLRVHMRIHSGEKRFQCGHCEKKFTQYTTLKYHIVSLHTGAKNYTCEFCGKCFARSNSLIVHRRLHTGERDFVCEYCDKTFRCSGHLRTHRRLHTGEKPYSCEVCHKRFRINADMKRHRNSVHFKLGRSLSNVPNIVYVNNEDIITFEEEGCEVLSYDDQSEPLQVAISSIEHIGANYEL